MKKSIAVLLLVSLVSPVLAQDSDFVELYDGTVVRGEVELKKLPELRFETFALVPARQLVINDSLSVTLNSVHAFQSRQGYFRKTGDGIFARRIEAGNIDLYHASKRRPAYDWIQYTPSTLLTESEGIQQESLDYFSKDGSTLEKANFKNLKYALQDNPVSMAYLQKRKTVSLFQTVGLVAGLALTAHGFISQQHNGSASIKYAPIMLGVATVAGSVWLPQLEKNRLTRKAVRAYNHPGDF